MFFFEIIISHVTERNDGSSLVSDFEISNQFMNLKMTSVKDQLTGRTYAPLILRPVRLGLTRNQDGLIPTMGGTVSFAQDPFFLPDAPT